MSIVPLNLTDEKNFTTLLSESIIKQHIRPLTSENCPLRYTVFCGIFHVGSLSYYLFINEILFINYHF